MRVRNRAYGTLIEMHGVFRAASSIPRVKFHRALPASSRAELRGQTFTHFDQLRFAGKPASKTNSLSWPCLSQPSTSLFQTSVAGTCSHLKLFLEITA